MYTPYGNIAGGHPQQVQQPNLQNLGQQHGQFNGVGQNVNPQAAPYASFFQDPTTSMAAHLAKSGLGTSNEYLQQNIGSFMRKSGNLHYYFKVSNSYVLKKIMLILFPYTNKNWTRQTSGDAATTASASPAYLPPVQDINAPDLYIPLMAFTTYILLWASFQGLRGDFHPELFGYLASQTVACSIIDVAIFKIGLYLLNCSTQSSILDLLSFSGYKYVTIIALLLFKNLIGGVLLLYYALILFFTASLSLFLMRSLKFMVLPNVSAVSSASNSISGKQRKIRIQFLFVYAVIIQLIIIVFMST